MNFGSQLVRDNGSRLYCWSIREPVYCEMDFRSGIFLFRERSSSIKKSCPAGAGSRVGQCTMDCQKSLILPGTGLVLTNLTARLSLLRELPRAMIHITMVCLLREIGSTHNSLAEASSSENRCTADRHFAGVSSFENWPTTDLPVSLPVERGVFGSLRE